MRPPLFLAMLLVCGGCVGGGDDGALASRTAATRQGEPATAASETTLPGRGSAIELDCTSGQAGLEAGDIELGGMTTDFLAWQPGTWQESDLESEMTMSLWGQTYYSVKSVIYILLNASAQTEITVLEPETARLYYTDWGTWSELGNDPSAQLQEIAANAGTAVTLPACGDSVWGVPGFVLLDGPSCVTFSVTGEDPDWEETRTVPFYEDQCS